MITNRISVHYSCLKEFTACRLIPQNEGDDKLGNPGVRPIGIGKIQWRITGKTVVSSLELKSNWLLVHYKPLLD